MDTNLNIKITSDAQQALNAINRVVSSVNGISKGLNGDLTNQNSFFSQSTMALMSGTGSMIKGVGDQINRFTGQVRSSRVATEQARNGLLSMTDQSAEAVKGVDMLEETAKNVGEAFAISKSEILDAAYNLKGGMSFLSDESLSQMMDLQTRLGAATKAGAATTANMLANAGNTLGASLQNDQKAFTKFQFGFANSSAAIVNVAKAEGNQIAAFTKIVATSLQTKDQSIATQQALAGSFITVTGSGERAATQVNALASKWTKTFKGFQEMGIATMDSNGKLRDMVDVIGDLKGAYDSADALGKEKIIGQLGLLGDVNAKKALQNILTDYGNIVKYKDAANQAILEGEKAFMGAVRIEDTMMGRMASAFQNGPGFTMEQLKIKQQNLMEDIAKNVKGAQSPFISLQGVFTNFAQKIVSENPKLVGAMVGFGEAVGGAVSGFGGFMTQIGNIGRGIESLKLFQKTMENFGITNLFKKIIKENPLGPSLEMMKPLKFKPAIFASVKNHIRHYAQEGLNAIKTPVLKFKTVVDQGVASTAFGKIAHGFGEKMKGINWKGIGSGILKGAGILGAGMTIALPFLMKDKTIGPQIQGLFNEIMVALKPMLPLLTSLVQDVFNALKPVLPSLLEGFKAILPPIIDIVKTIVGALLPILPTLVDLFSTVAKVIAPIVKPLADLISKLMPVIKPLLEFVRVLVEVGGKIASTILGAISGLIGAILDALPDWMLTDEMERSKYAKRLEKGGGSEEDRRFAAKSMIINTLNDQAGFEGMNQENFDSYMEKLSPQQRGSYMAFINKAVKDGYAGSTDLEASALSNFSNIQKMGTDGKIPRLSAEQYTAITQAEAEYGRGKAKASLDTYNKLKAMGEVNPGMKLNPMYQYSLKQAENAVKQQNITHSPSVTITVQGNADMNTVKSIDEVTRNAMSNATYDLSNTLGFNAKMQAMREIPKQG